jgi:hypothetical protein
MVRLTWPWVYILKVVSLIVLFALPIGQNKSALAAKTIYRCTKDGQITLTDKPCDAATSSDGSASAPTSQSGATTIASSSNPTPVGDWHGQM